MANRVEAFSVGVGSILEVTQHLMENATLSTIERETVKELAVLLDNPETTPEVAKALKAIVAAYLNLDYQESGMLFRVNSTGRLTFDYHVDGGQRKMMAALMAG